MRILKIYMQEGKYVIESINQFNHSWKHRYATQKGLFDHLDSCSFAIQDWEIETSKELFANVVRHLLPGNSDIELRELEMNQDFSVDGYLPCGKCGVWIDDGSYSEGTYLCHDCLDNRPNNAEKGCNV